MSPVADVSQSSLVGLLNLVGRVAVVTGGARGIGYATASRLIEAGARVVVADVAGQAARAATARLGEAALAAHVDVADEGSVRALAQTAVDAWGRLDIWGSTAG